MLKRTNEEGPKSLWGFPRPEITWKVIPLKLERFHCTTRQFKPGFHVVFVGLCRSLWVADGLTVLGKTMKDRERPNGNTNVCDPQ